jgi:type VI secretion system protein ImpL
MLSRRLSGYVVAVIALAVVAAAWAYFKGTALGPDPAHRTTLVVLAGVVLLLLRTPLTATWRFVARHTPGLGHYKRDPAARATVTKAPVFDASAHCYDQLQLALEQLHGWRWRYAQRWLLLTGDATTVDELVPGLSESRWRVTPDAVLFYAGSPEEPAADWLEHIRRARHRPVDAVIAVLRAPNEKVSAGGDTMLAKALFRLGRALRWAAPAYVLYAAEVDSTAPSTCESIGCTWADRRTQKTDIESAVSALSRRLATIAVERLADPESNRNLRYLAQLSRFAANQGIAIAAEISTLDRRRGQPAYVHGVWLAPLIAQRSPDVMQGPDALPWTQATWEAIAAHSRRVRGRRVGFSWSNLFAWTVTACVAAWLLGTLISFTFNREAIVRVQTAMQTVQAAKNRTQSLQALDAVQKELDTLDTHQQRGAPWRMRFGLNRDGALQAALWPQYATASGDVLVQPLRAELEQQLQKLGTLSDQALANRGDDTVKGAYADLKAYLMLAEPKHADASFLTQQQLAESAAQRPLDSSLSAGAWKDLMQHLVAFHVNHLAKEHLPADVSLAVTATPALVNAARQTLVGVIGLQNSTDTVYQQILAENRDKYPPVSLQTLLGDSSSRGLFITSETLAGVFTRSAWDERIGKAIDEAGSTRTVQGDWVLSDTKATSAAPSADALRTALRERYFNDYARAWQQFLNSVRWQPDNSLSGTVDQMNLLADPQHSPLSALFKMIVYQAGTGTDVASLSDTLVNKAKQLVQRDEPDPSKNTAAANTPPLANAFEPLILLAGGEEANTPQKGSFNSSSSDISLSRYLERVTAVRLKLQQIMMSNDPDAMSLVAAQAIFQGKTSELADSRDYANRLAASLGQAWGGLGDALFQRPLDQAWHAVLKPAAASLNETWRDTIVSDWNASFDGRYPFADSDNDASLPELARFLRANNGVMAQFVQTQLGGVLERQGDHWVEAQGTGHQALHVDPAFLDALNRLQRIANVLFPPGEPRVRYELRGVPTPDITDFAFVLSGRELHYFNQRETWMPFEWPGDALDNATRIDWQTQQGGLRSTLEFDGRFGLIRLLEHATVTQQDSARYLLSWKPSLSTMPDLRVQLRGETGKGPLEVLALRHFVLPTRIFLGNSDGNTTRHFEGGPLPPNGVAASNDAPVLPRIALPERD